jgi:hypothetical protein
MPRGIAKLQYAAVRLPFTLLDERLIARYWDQDAIVRVGFERWLGSLDLLAGRLLGNDEISRRGLALMRLTRDPAQEGTAMDAPVQPGQPGESSAGTAGQRPGSRGPPGRRHPRGPPARELGGSYGA